MGLFDNIKFPYFNQQQLNLDWILIAVKSALKMLPDDNGTPGQVLKLTDDGTAWEDIGALSVDIHSLPQDTEIAATDEMIFYDKSASANRKITYQDAIASSASNASPLMNGTASPGTSKLYSRYNHVHPTDTSRAPAAWFTDGALQVSHGGTGTTTLSGLKAAMLIPGIQFEYININSGATGALVEGNIQRGILVTAGPSVNDKSMHIFATTATGTTSITTVLAGTNVTVTGTAGGELDIANSGANQITAFVLHCSGI